MKWAVVAMLIAGLCTPAVPLFVGSAAAASFDCNQATTAFERAICDNPELSADDDVLAVAYATAIGGLSSQAGVAMRAGQREWLAYVERACTPDGQPLTVPYDEDGVTCLLNEFSQRIERLEHSRMIGGKRFYLVEKFMTEPPGGEEEWNKVTTRAFSTVQIDGDDALARGFNGYVDAQSEPLLSGFMPRAEGAEPAEGDTEDLDFQSDVLNTVSVDRVASAMISLEAMQYWYGHGAAHGNYAISYWHFRTDEMRAVTAADIFAGEDWPEPLAGLVTTALRSFYGDALWDDVDQAVLDVVDDITRWRFTEQGIEFRFQPYEVTAYAAGSPTALVNWVQLRDLLTEGGESLASY
jgi:uncharacterized protein